jgi:hypothetical protein
MRKLISLGCLAVVAASLLVAPAGAATKQQSIEGTIALPTPFTDDSGCFAGVHRRVHAVAGDAINGVFGYSFAVDKATWNKPFKLDVTGGQNYVDLDINFYLGPLTTVDDIVAAQGDPAAPPTVAVETRQAGGETGIVPKGAENVIVCMYGGQAGIGVASSFTYLAGKGVK